MNFIGIDHGTESIRIASRGDINICLELPRKGFPGFEEAVRDHLDLREIDVIAFSYSMGDSLKGFATIDQVEDYGIRSLAGAGEVTGTGRALFDELRETGIECWLAPGLHAGSPFIDHRFSKMYSHSAAGDKVLSAMWAMNVLRAEVEEDRISTGPSLSTAGDLIISDVGANTVTVAMKQGRLVGGIDATLLAPGMTQGPLDLDMIRDVDAGRMTANEAFTEGGLGDLDMASLDALALGVSMEMLALQAAASTRTFVVVGRGAEAFCRTSPEDEEAEIPPIEGESDDDTAVGCRSSPSLVILGSSERGYELEGGRPTMAHRLHMMLSEPLGDASLILGDRFSTAIGGTHLAETLHARPDEVMGIPVLGPSEDVIE